MTQHTIASNMYMSSSNSIPPCNKVIHGGYELYRKVDKTGESPQAFTFELCKRMEMELGEDEENPVVFKKGLHLFGFAQPSTIYSRLSTLPSGEQDLYIIARDEDEKFGWLDVEIYASLDGVYNGTDILCEDLSPEKILSKIMSIYDKVSGPFWFDGDNACHLHFSFVGCSKTFLFL